VKIKEEEIKIRIEKSRKENWKKICTTKNISLTSLIINSVENRMMDDERKKVIAFIEKQDNLFAKIENNINQVAKIANGQKFIRGKELIHFEEQLKTVIELKKQQNEIFIKIYSLIADDR
jgi:hypothetical protein